LLLYRLCCGGKERGSVSSKKDKLIAEAQRFALRGQLDKAVKAYEQVVAQDPAAINQRQRLAELLVKVGRIESARNEFEEIGKSYATNGYYLKAIAVFKKLQVMFPGDIDITLKLAELNEKHGLVANALAEYKQVFDYYEKNDFSTEALSILEKMHAVDQQNVGIKLKLAEAYCQAGNRDGAYEIFSRLASLLQERGDSAGLGKLNSRMQQLFPEKNGFMLEVLAGQVRGDAASTLGAVGALQAMLRSNPTDKRIWELVIEAYQRLGQPERVRIAYQHCIRFFPDDLSVQKGLMESLIAEKDVAGAIQLLDQYEQNFIDRNACGDLLDIYRSLERIDPINMRVLLGLKRSLEAVGDGEGAAALDHKIDSLHSLTTRHATPDHQPTAPDGDREPEQTAAPAEQDEVELEGALSPGDMVEMAGFGHETGEPPAEPPAPVFPEGEDIEIEIELDDETEPFEALSHDAAVQGAEESAWLEAVDNVFDATAASGRSVKFGSEVDMSDAQSHYDLGVAFKEMGLYDEAVNEFLQAADDPSRRVACLILQGTCLREKGNLDVAESVLRSLLKPGLGLEDGCSVKYELALTCEAAGKADEAAGLLAEIDATQPGFRDVRSRLDASGERPALEFSDEELKGFDL
jgi:tetratricopeptide (TPR) repeat protein